MFFFVFCILKRRNSISVLFFTLCRSRCLGSQVGPGRAGCKDCAPGRRHKTPLIIVHVFFAKENVQIGQMMIW